MRNLLRRKDEGQPRYQDWCYRVRYPSKETALATLGTLLGAQAANKLFPRDVLPFRCGRCKGWHLTTYPILRSWRLHGRKEWKIGATEWSKKHGEDRLEAAELDAIGEKINSFDPFWDIRNIVARMDAAAVRGDDENLAALGGPFYVTGDATEVDIALTAMAMAPTMPDGQPWREPPAL